MRQDVALRCKGCWHDGVQRPPVPFFRRPWTSDHPIPHASEKRCLRSAARRRLAIFISDDRLHDVGITARGPPEKALVFPAELRGALVPDRE